jgi:uncharacterized protein YndB with AHSA1/START domain
MGGVLELERTIRASPEDVFAVIGDGWTYPTWVVGAVRMRAVEPDYPKVGSRLHHSVGIWPFLMIEDHTTVTACEPNRRLTLQARAWPAGEAVVDFRLDPVEGGTLVVMGEDAVAGPGRLVPRPMRYAGLLARNKETLRRLAFLAERRTAP